MYTATRSARPGRPTIVAAMLALACLMFAAPGGAAPPADTTKSSAATGEQAEIIKHLKSLGYSTRVKKRRVEATHKTFLNITIKHYGKGMLIQAVFTGSAKSKHERSAFLELVNTMNRAAQLNRYYLDKDGDLLVEAFTTERYAASSFGAFLALFNEDFSRVSGRHSKVLGRYLK